MTTAFLVLLGAHVVHSVLANLLRLRESEAKRIPVFQVAVQVPLFFSAGAVAVGGAFAAAAFRDAAPAIFSRQLVSPVYVGAGFLAGHVIFAISLLITHQSLQDTISHLLDLGALWDFAVDSPIVLTRYLSVAIGEEMIWRAAAQPVLVSLAAAAGLASLPAAAVGIVAIAVGFAIVHEHFYRNTLVQNVEFLGFAFLLGLLYYWTGSLILVTVIHALRNIEVAYLEFLIKAEELGDPEQAARELEESFYRRRLASKTQ